MVIGYSTPVDYVKQINHIYIYYIYIYNIYIYIKVVVVINKREEDSSIKIPNIWFLVLLGHLSLANGLL